MASQSRNREQKPDIRYCRIDNSVDSIMTSTITAIHYQCATHLVKWKVRIGHWGENCSSEWTRRKQLSFHSIVHECEEDRTRAHLSDKNRDETSSIFMMKEKKTRSFIRLLLFGESVSRLTKCGLFLLCRWVDFLFRPFIFPITTRTSKN